MDCFDVGFAVEFHAEDSFVVHSADNPIAGLVVIAVEFAGIVDARRCGLIDAVFGGEFVVVVAERKVAHALVVVVFALAAQSGGAVGFVGDENAGGCAAALERFRNPMPALVCAENDANLLRVFACLYPLGDFGGVGGNRALDFGCADIAVVERGIGGGVARAFLANSLCGIVV